MILFDAYLWTSVRLSTRLVILLLITNPQRIDIPSVITNCVINFVTDRTQAIVMDGKRSLKMAITRSIVQGSGLGPH